MDVERLLEYRNKGYSIRKIARILKCHAQIVSAYLKSLGISTNRIVSVNSCFHCLKQLNRRGRYCDFKCQRDYLYRQYIEKWLSGDVNGGKAEGEVSTHVRRYLFEKYHSECSVCKWSKINPTTGKIPLTINHKDGNSENHQEANLELLCPNCHSLTSNYGSLNRGNGRKKRRQKLNQNCVAAL